MQYLVLTHLVSSEGRRYARSSVTCADKAEAIAMAYMFNGQHNPGNQTINRRAIVCVTGYSEAGKYTIPIDELRHIKGEVRSD